MRRLIVCALVVGAAVIAPTGAGADDPSSLQYCTPAGGPLGAITDAEHTVVLGDQPLPRGVTRTRETVDGVSTPVMQAGPADAHGAVVFVHGNPGSSRDFDQLVGATGKFTRVVAFDMPGFGHADKGFDGTYTTQSTVQFIGDMVAHLGITRVHLALHDFGGIWALEWARANPGSLGSVVLMDTGVLTGYLGHPFAYIWNVPAIGEENMATTTRQTFESTLNAQNPRPLPQAFLDRMYDDYDRQTRCAVLSYYRDLGNSGESRWEAQTAVFSKLDLPALVIWGADDPYIPSSQAENQKNAFPQAEIHVLPDTGHWPFVDEPGTTRNLVTSFLRRVVARRP
ncbi:MAG TPA: alpha/beta hydrolase [Thermoleophilaceae bacterium]